MQAAMSRMNSAVGRVWPARVELDKQNHVVRMRNANINRALSHRWKQGPIFVKVLEISEAQRLKGLSENPTVTVTFSMSLAKIKKMTVGNHRKEGIMSVDLDERQLAALGLNWSEGRFWTKEEEDDEMKSDQSSDSEELPELEEVGDDAAGAGSEVSQGNWASVVAGNAERAAEAAAAEEARVAVEAAAQMEAAAAAAAVAEGAVEDAHLAREVAEIDAATAAKRAQGLLAMAKEKEREAEAAAAAAAEAAAAARMAAEDAMVRATPTLERAATMRVTPPMVTSAATRSMTAREAARAAEAPGLARKAASAAEAAVEVAATVVASVEEEMWRVAGVVGCSMARQGLRKLIDGGYGPEELASLGGLGEEIYDGVLADAVGAGRPLTALEKAALKKYMVLQVETPKKSSAEIGGGRLIDFDEVESVASSGAEEPAPRKAAPAGAPAAAAVSRLGSRVKELVSLLRPSEAIDLVVFARDAVLETLLERAPRKAELQRPEMALELWLEKELALSAAACKEAASGDMEEMEMWVMRTIYKVEAERSGKKVAVGGGKGEGEASGMMEAASLAAMIAAGGGANQSDPILLEALKESAGDPTVAMQLEVVKKLFGEGKPVAAAGLLSALNEKPSMATIYYKAGEVKHVQGSSVISGANAVVVLVGSVRESVEMDVAKQIESMLPPTCDARELARKLVRGKVNEISFENTYGSKSGSSVMGAAVKAEKEKGGVDATSDSYIMVMRGMSLMVVGYARAHPFDEEAAFEWARLLSDLARAVQDGLSLEAAVAVILDPVLQELSLRWKDVARGAALARPRMAEVAESTKEKRRFHLTQRLEMQRRGAPAAPKGGAGASGAREGEGKKGGEADALKKVQKQAEEALRVAKAATASRAPTKPQGTAAAANPAREWLQEDQANADKCFYFSKRGKCTQGKECKFFEGTPGHNE